MSGIYAIKKLEKVDDPLLFLRDKLKRLMPALIIVVFATAFLLGPLITEESIGAYFLNANTYKYLLNGIFIPTHSLPGVFSNNPLANVVNGSLWTLPLEMICCIGIAILYQFKIYRNNKTLLVSSGFLLLMWTAVSFAISRVIPHYNIHLDLCLMFFIGTLAWSYKSFIELNVCTFVTCCIGIIMFFCVGFCRGGVILFMPYIISFVCYYGNLITGRKILKRLENSTYEMYLLAFPIQQIFSMFFSRWNMEPWINAVLAFIVIMPVAILINGIVIKLLAVRSKMNRK